MDYKPITKDNIETRNPKSDSANTQHPDLIVFARIPEGGTNSNTQYQNSKLFWSFEIRILDLFRVSKLEFRIS
jgi:hypothetical protein